MLRRSICRFVTAASLLAIAAVAVAQEGPQPAKPGPEHARLKAMEGTWDTTMKMEGAPESKGEATYKMELGGLWLVGDFKSDFMGQPFTGKGLDTYDASKKKYIGVWADSWSTNPMLMEGNYDEKTKTLTMLGSMTEPDGKVVKTKGITKFIDDNNQQFTMFIVGDDGKEMPAFTIDYKRRK